MAATMSDNRVIIELLSLSGAAEARRADVDWKSAFLKRRGQFGPKFQVQRGPSPPTNRFPVRKLGEN